MSITFDATAVADVRDRIPDLIQCVVFAMMGDFLVV
jgi:hypothetical protein